MPEKKKSAARKPAEPQKKSTGKAPSKHAAPVKKTAPAAPVQPEVKSPFSEKDLERFKNLLLDLRARLTGQVSSLASESLTVADETPSDDRTDDFDREFALNVAGSVQDALFEIDEALRRIQDGRYGICEVSGKAIEKERLKALPYARYCVSVQAAMEKGRTRYRPFGNVLVQPPEREPNSSESEEQE
ncbi:MAG: TraR/DksA C4-type zinc finger protein [Kiritimatiellia bacterium]